MSDFSFVDLTSSSPSSSADQNLVTMYSHHPRSQLSFDVPEGARSPKRRRLDHSSIAGPSSHPSSHHRQFSIPNNEPNIESIDLTEVNDGRALSKALAKQRADAIKVQNSRADEARSTLTAYKCPVCMDVCTDATSTICGHLFCHKCIIDTLRFGEERRTHDGHGKTPRGNCPVCRQVLSRVDAPGPKRNLVPLQLNLTTRKRG